MFFDLLKRIINADIYDLARETPLEKAGIVSTRLNNNILIKREDLQPVYSFKIRGAYNKIRKLPNEELRRGVITASAGNHAQGVSMSATHLGINSTIVLPVSTPKIKVEGVRRLGGKAVLHGNTFEEARLYAQYLSKTYKQPYIPPYDDLDVIAGQGTIAMEILRQHEKNIDAIFIPVGGGGLCAGIASYCKNIRPDIRIIAVEAEESASFTAALQNNKRVVLRKVGRFAEGVSVAQVGRLTFGIMKQHVDEVITVNRREICVAMSDIFHDTRILTEPAGAVSMAGLKKYVNQKGLQEKTLVSIQSGANIDLERLNSIFSEGLKPYHQEDPPQEHRQEAFAV